MYPVWLQICVRQYFHEFRYYLACHENIGLENFISPCVLINLLKYFKPVSKSSLHAITNWKIKVSYCSIQFYSCSKPGSVKIAIRWRDWTSHPVCALKQLDWEVATTGNYTILHGTCTSAALRHFKKEFPELKRSSVRGSMWQQSRADNTEARPFGIIKGQPLDYS